MDIEKIIKESRNDFDSRIGDMIETISEKLSIYEAIGKVAAEVMKYSDTLLIKYHQALMDELAKKSDTN